MESSSANPLFTWLTEQNTPTLVWQSKRVHRYQEAEFCETSYRYRIVYSEQSALIHICAWLEKLQGDFKIAQLHRESELFGWEISAEQSISDAHLNTFESIDAADIYPVSSSMPSLDLPGLFVMDMDSTAIEIECIDELAAMAGVGEAVAAVTELAMQGELDFEQSLRQRVAQLSNADASIIDQLCAQLPLTQGLQQSVLTLQKYGWRVVVASGGFTPFVNHLKDQLALDGAFANELVIIGGKLSGQVTGAVVDAQYKADVVRRCAEQWHIAEGQRVAIGDGANDIPMLQIADYGIAYHAKPKLKAEADVSINKLDLGALPFLFLKS